MDLDNAIAVGRLDPSFALDPGQPFTPAMAATAGLTRHHLRRLVEAGLVRRAVRRVYVPAHLEDTLELRARSLSLVVPADCVVTDRHAGWLQGATMILAPGEHLELRPLTLFRPSGHGRVRNDLTISGERNLTAQDITEVHGVRTTTPIRTAWDLGRVRWTDEAITGLDAMLRLGAFSLEELLAGIGRFRGMRWVSTLRAMGPLADGRSESPGESVLRMRCRECGLLDMVPQIEVRRSDGSFVARIDLGHEGRRLGVEHDGEEWHTSPPNDSTTACVEQRPSSSADSARGQKMMSPDLRRERSSLRASSRISVASVSERRSFT